MNLFTFWINKPKSISIRTDILIDAGTITALYTIYDCLLYKSRMTNFVIKNYEIENCKIRWKIYLSYVDVLVYTIFVIGMCGGAYWERKVGFSLFGMEAFVFTICILFFFTFLKITRILSIRLKDGKEYFIPVSGFIVYPLKKEERLKIKDFYNLLNSITQNRL